MIVKVCSEPWEPEMAPDVAQKPRIITKSGGKAEMKASSR